MKFTRIALSYMLRYLLGFLLVFLGSIFVYTVAKKSIESYVMEAAELRMEEGIGGIQKSIEKMDLIAQLIKENASFTDLVYQKQELPDSDILKLKESGDLLSDIGILADDASYLFVLFKNNDLYISSSQSSRAFSDYFGKFMDASFSGSDLEKMNSESFKQYLFESADQNQRFLQTKNFRYSYDGREYELSDALLYLGGRDYLEFERNHVSCFVLQKDFLIEQLLMPEIQDSGFLYVEDLHSKTQLLRSGALPEQVESSENGEKLLFEDENYRVLVKSNEELGWRVVMGVPDSFLAEQMRPVESLLLGYVWLGLLAVLLLTLLFSVARYREFQKILVSFPADETYSSSQNGFSAYQILTERVRRLRETRREYFLEAENLKRQNQAILLENLIVRGAHTPQEIQALGEYLGKEPEFYCVAIVRFWGQEEASFEEIVLSMQQFLKNRGVSLLACVRSGISDEVFLIERFPHQEANVQDLQACFEELSTQMTGHYGVTFHVGLSTVGTKVENLSKCYEQARKMIQAQYAAEHENAVKAYGITENDMYENPLTPEFFSRLSNMLTCGQGEEVCLELEKMESFYQRRPYLYESYKEQIFYAFRNLFYTVMLQLEDKKDAAALPLYHPNMNCVELFSLLCKEAKKIEAHIAQGKKSKNENLKEEILNYIRKHYTEAGLSAYLVSQGVGISEKYLFHFLKEQTGETFSALLMQVRMERAKQYLEETDYNNEKIASLTGFVSASTFYRNFNKTMGVTPKVYRENHQKEAKNT